MTKSVTKSALLLAALGAMLVVLHTGSAMAVTFPKTYVSNTGSNANNCSTVALACASFASALTSTAPGGEITVVNTGDYGPLTINKSINITNDGAGEASLMPIPNSGSISISAGAGDIVSLRGLVLDGQGVGQSGIVLQQASGVHVQNCVVRNFQGGDATGIVLDSFGNTQVFISDTIVFNNGSFAGTGGISIAATGSGTTGINVVLDRVHLENNVVGLRADGSFGTGNGVHLLIRDSVVSGNASNGIEALSAPGKAPAFIIVEHTSSVNNGGTGILANGPRATMLLDGNVVGRNGVGISAVNSGQLISYGNNKVNNNLGADGAPTGSYSPI